MTEEEFLCKICGKNPDEHKELENLKILNHQFSNDGELNPTDRSPQKPEKKNSEVMVLPGADLLLRKLLVEKGVLSDSDFSDAGAIGWQRGGDRENRSEEGSE